LAHLSFALLGLRAAPKDEANLSSAEATLVPSSTSQPGDHPLHNQRASSHHSFYSTDLRRRGGIYSFTSTTYYLSLRMAWSCCRPPLPYLQQAVQDCGAQGQNCFLQFGDRQEWVSLDRLKLHVSTTKIQSAAPPQSGRPLKLPVDDQ